MQYQPPNQAQPLNQSPEYQQPYQYQYQYQYQQQYPYGDVPVGQPVQSSNMQYYYNQNQYQHQGVQYVYNSSYTSGMNQTSILFVQQAPIQNASGYAFPVQIQCPYCQKVGSTRLDYRIGDHTLLAGCLILLVCWPLFWLPCVLDECKDRVHLCCHCHHQVGVKRYEMC